MYKVIANQSMARCGVCRFLASAVSKVFICALWLLLSSAMLSSEIVDWKGRDAGAASCPDWASSLFTSGDERQCRKQFNVSRREMIIYGSAAAGSVEAAMAAAREDAHRMAAGCGVVTLNALVPLCDYWQKDDAAGYTAFVVYTWTGAASGRHGDLHHADRHHGGY